MTPALPSRRRDAAATSEDGQLATDPDPLSHPARLTIDLAGEPEPWLAAIGLPLGELEAAVQATATAIGNRQGLLSGTAEVALALSRDAEVADLNGRYRGKPHPTNVLAFPAPPGRPDPDAAPGGPVYLGDIAVALETVIAEADSAGIPRLHHLQHLVVHALLHLLGYDHATSADAETMEVLETSILATLGIPDPYADTQPVGTADRSATADGVLATTLPRRENASNR